MEPNAAVRRTPGSRPLVLGVTCMLLGFLAMLSPVMAGMSVAMLLGAVVLVAGIIRIAGSLQVESPSRRLFMLVVGALTLLVGIALLVEPIRAVGLITVLLTAYFLLDGALEVVSAIRQRGLPGAGWLLASGALSILLGALMWSQYPLSGAWAMGILLGIRLFLAGLVMVTGGWTLRTVAKRVA